MGTLATKPTGAMTGTVTAKNDFGSQMMQAQSSASVAVAAQAQAAVQARYIMAMNRPRDWEEVRVKLLKACNRPGFAASARFSKPVGGGKVQGWTIRFAEEAMRCMGNLYPETTVIDEGEMQRIVQQSCTDLENNLTFSNQVIIDKTVERSMLKDGQRALSQRQNSSGKTTYRVEATEDDLLNKQGALLSKALRTQVLRLLPGDIQDECLRRLQDIQHGDVKADPQEAKRKLIDAFAEIGINPSDLAEYLGHALERVQPAEIIDLREIYTALKSGEATWEGIMESKQPSGSTEAAAEVGAAKLAAMQQAKAQPKPDPQPAAQTEPDPEFNQEAPQIDPNDTPFETKPQPRKGLNFFKK
jgi:hypothetical protein